MGQEEELGQEVVEVNPAVLCYILSYVLGFTALMEALKSVQAK